MKRGIALLLTLAVSILLCACGASEQPPADTPAVQQEITQPAPTDPTEAAAEETAPIPEETAPLQTEETKADITAFFPEDWEGRYILVEKDNGILVCCKKAYESNGEGPSILFSVYHITGDMVLPDYMELGMYEGYPVHAVVPWEIPKLATDEVSAEYTDMIYEVGDILDDIQEFLNGGLDLDDYTADTRSISGVYRLDSAEWTEDSKAELLSPISQHSFISIDNGGGLYFFIDGETSAGVAMTNEDFMDTDEPNCLVILSDGVVHPAYWLQGVLTVHGMETYTDIAGNVRSDWTYFWEDENFWTEESLRDDIG